MVWAGLPPRNVQGELHGAFAHFFPGWRDRQGRIHVAGPK